MPFDKKEVQNLFNRLGGAMLIFLLAFDLLCGGAATIAEELTQITSSTIIYVLTELLNSLAYIVAYTVPVWFFLAISKGKAVESFGLTLSLAKRDAGLTSAAMMFLGTATCFAASYVNSLLFPISEEAAELYFSNDIRGGYVLILMFISTAIVPAFVEELLFRGVVLSSIRPYSESGAILISALLFGLMHQTPFQLLYATAIGVILGIIRVKTGSIWTGVLVHFCNNFLSVVQTYLLDCYDVYTGNVVYTIITLSISAVGFVLGGALYTKKQREEKGKNIATIGFFRNDRNIFKKLSLQVENKMIYRAFFSPTMIIFIILCGFSMLSTAILLVGVPV